jgi:hypothetical protein
VAKLRLTNHFFNLLYALLTVFYLSRVLSFCGLSMGIYYGCFDEDDITENTDKLDMYSVYLITAFEMPKAALLTVLGLLYVINMQTNYEAHFDVYTLNTQYHDKKKIWNWVSLFLTLFTCACSMSYSITFFFDKISVEYFILGVGAMDIFTIIGYVGLGVLKTKRFTGYPYCDEYHAAKARYVNRVTLFFVIGRCLELTALSLLLIFVSLDLNDLGQFTDLDNPTSLGIFLGPKKKSSIFAMQ